MPTSLEDLRVLKTAEAVADAIWKEVMRWDGFARDVVGGQLARAADSIGANIAESFGRFNYGEKLQFLYYSRGSLFETKYWLNRCLARGLMQAGEVDDYIDRLTEVARQLNTFAGSLKAQRTSSNSQKPTKTIREVDSAYVTETQNSDLEAVFADSDLQFLISDL